MPTEMASSTWSRRRARRRATTTSGFFRPEHRAGYGPPVIARVEATRLAGPSVLVRARVHDHKSPSQPHDWRSVVLRWTDDRGTRDIPLRWYGEYLWRRRSSRLDRAARDTRSARRMRRATPPARRRGNSSERMGRVRILDQRSRAWGWQPHSRLPATVLARYASLRAGLVEAACMGTENPSRNALISARQNQRSLVGTSDRER